MSKCPHCGVEIQEGATICWICQRRQIFQDDDYEAKSKSMINRSAIGSMFLAILMLLAFGLTGYVLFDWNMKVAGLFALFFSLFIGWLGTRGRYIMPTMRQYLITMFISLIPVLGTAYGLFFTGRYLTEYRILRYIAYLCLISSVALLIYWKVYQGEYNFRNPFSFLKLSISSTPTRRSSDTPTPPTTSSATPHVSPTSIPSQVAATGENPALAGCIPWSSVTMEIVGQNVCIFGDYQSISQKQDSTYVLNFSDEAGAFQVWSYPKPFEPYLPKDGKQCVVVRGWMKTSGIRPIMIIGAQGKLEPCP
jgi:hypothetical protein